MKRILLSALLVSLLAVFTLPLLAASDGLTHHQIQVYDELGRKVTGISSVYIYNPGTTTPATIYKGTGKTLAITVPMTTTSTNTTLADGFFEWWGGDQYDFTISDGTDTFTSGSRVPALDSTTGKLIFPLFLKDVSSTAYEDDETITLGTSSDWVINAGTTADLLTFTPATDGAVFRVGLAAGSKSADLQWYTGAGVGLLIDEGADTLGITGLTTSINASSNYNTNINTGTSTGAVSIGNSAAGAIAVDTTSTITVNADASQTYTVTDTVAGNAFVVTTTDGGVAITAAGAANGDMTVTSGDDLTLATTGLTTITNAGGIVLDGIVTQTIIVEGTADACEVTLSFTDPTADVTFAFPVMSAQTVSVMTSTLATNAPDIASSVTGGTSQLIFEGTTADACEAILTASDPTADTIWTLPVAPAGTYYLMGSTLATNAVDAANSIWGGTNQIIFEGATADACETVLTLTDPTGDRTITLPNATGTVALLTKTPVVMAVTDDNAITVTAAQTGYILVADGNVAEPNTHYTLPAAAAGLNYVIVDSNATAANDVWITAASGDTINGGTSGKSYVNTGDVAGASVFIFSVDDTRWIAMPGLGTWANDNN
jgi:hypothetical protein